MPGLKWKDNMKEFSLASALVTGSSHRQLHYNCQDAIALHQDDGFIVGIVADGCGSGRHSQVGACLGAEFAMEFCKRHFRKSQFDAAFLLQNMIEYLHQLCDLQMPSDRTAFIEDHFLFTLFGFVSTPQETHLFHAGDGYIVVNSKEWRIDHDNRPRYIGRHLLGGKATLLTERFPTAEIERLLIGTDGLRDFPGPLTELWENEDYFTNPAALPKQLTDLASQSVLKDDVGVVLLRAR